MQSKSHQAPAAFFLVRVNNTGKYFNDEKASVLLLSNPLVSFCSQKVVRSLGASFKSTFKHLFKLKPLVKCCP